MTSDSGPGDFFSRMATGAAGEYEAERTAAFEETCVKKLLLKSGVELRLAVWYRELLDSGQPKRLTLLWMLDRWPMFPLLMAASKYQYPGKLPYAALLGAKLSKLSVFRDYGKLAEYHDIDPARERFGMIFKCKRAKHACIQVLHNQPQQSTVQDFDGTPEKAEGTHCRRFMFWYRGVHYVIEGIDSFVGTVGKDWAADG